MEREIRNGEHPLHMKEQTANERGAEMILESGDTVLTLMTGTASNDAAVIIPVPQL